MVDYRATLPSDAAVVVQLALRSGLFASDDVAIVEELMSDYSASMNDRGHRCVLAVVDEAAVGVAYYQPAPATDRTWYLTMIGVRADRQGQGHGSALLAHVEDELRTAGHRLLLVETSGTEGFAATRRFYDRCGYTAVATVSDYYEAGDDLVVFSKRLPESIATPAPPRPGT